VPARPESCDPGGAGHTPGSRPVTPLAPAILNVVVTTRRSGPSLS